MAYSYWRLNLTSPGYCAIYEIEMRASRGGADQCSGGTPTASSVWASQVAANAFDDNTGTYWESGVSGGSHWIQYQFGSAVDVAEVVIYQGYTINERVISFNLQGSNDGSSWTTVQTEMSCDTWSSAGAQRFLIGGSKTYWQIQVDAVTSGSYARIAEIEMRLTEGGADECSGGIATATSVFSTAVAANAFDNSDSTYWESNTTPTPHTIRYHFDDEKEIVEYALTAHTSALNEMPIGWTLQSSGDGINWTDEEVVSGESAWSGGEQRVYNGFAGGGGAARRPVYVIAS